MADLHKFIRQQFSDNNWSKQCDLSKVSITKLKEIAEAFNQLDVKSKLTLTFTYTNSVVPSDPGIAELIESVVLQALDEDNNFVRCIATALHSRHNFGHLIFDLSETSESFAKTLDSLRTCSTDGHISTRIPPLAELLDARITDAALDLSSSSPLPRELRSNCLNSFCGFTIREKTPAQRMKESYLDRLQEECERRRVHVPIPGRSFGKQDGGEEVSCDGLNHNPHNLHSESPLGSRRAPSFPRRSSLARKTDIPEGQTSTPTGSANTGSLTSTSSNTSARAKLLAMHNRSPAAVAAVSTPGRNDNSNSSSGATGNTSRRMMLLASSTTSEPCERTTLRHLNTSGASVAGSKRSSGIKLLDFQDLPAIGIQAKKLRKEQQEKEREEKRKEREQKAQERREARDAARRARMLAHAAATAGGKKTGVAILSPPSHPVQQTVVSQALPLLQPIPQQPPRLQPGLGTVAATTKSMSWDLQQPWTPFAVGPARNHRVRQPNRQGGSDQSGGDEVADDDDEDYEDDEEEECETVVGADGAFHLTAPRGFRGFTETIPQNSVSLQPQQAAAPTATILLQRSTQGGHFVPQLITTGQQAAAQGGVFQAVPGGPRFRLVRPWTPSSQGQAPQEGTAGGEGVTATASTRLVQLPDGRIALATTAPHQISQQQQQQPQAQQQQTVIIANSGTRLQMAATPNAQIPASLPTSTVQAATGSPQQVLIRSPALVPTATPHQQQQQTTVMVSSSLPQATLQVPVGQTVPLVTSPRLQPRLIQIRPRTPVLSTTASTVGSVAPTTAAAPGTIPVVLPSLSSSTANITSSGSTGFQQRPRFVVANSFRQVAPTPPQQQTLMRIVPRPTQPPIAPATTGGAKQLLPQPAPAQPPPPLTQPKEKIHLTSTQLTSIQTLFQGANRLTRPDKAIILSFFSGKRVNPQPEGGTALRIRLSEYRERVIDAASGKVMDVAAETFIHLDYATGKFERVKSYRTLPLEQLMALPVQPKTATTAGTTTSAP